MEVLNKVDDYVTISSKLNKYKDKKLCDFYISGAFRPYLCKNQYFEYVDLGIFEKIIKAGVRAIYIDVFNDSMGNKANPVIATGVKKGQWKLSLNTILFDDFCKKIATTVFNAGYVNNFEDPFILILNLNMQRNIVSLNKMKNIIYKYFARYLLSNQYTFSKNDIGQIKMEDLKQKIVIISSPGYEGSQLDEFINYSWDKDAVKKIHYAAIDPEATEADVLNIDTGSLKNYNKNNITIVTPRDRFSLRNIFTKNYNPTYFWELGCQIVLQNYQLLDENLDEYLLKFKEDSFILKPDLLRGADKKESINLMSTNLSNNMNSGSQNSIRPGNSNCMEAPSEDYSASQNLVTLKDANSNNGLCFVIKDSGNCNNLQEGTNIEKNDYITVSLPNNTDYKMCCSNYPVNNVGPIENDGSNGQVYKHFITNQQSTETTYPSLDINLIEGQDNYSKNADSSSTFYLEQIDSSTLPQNDRVCLIDINKSNKKCPSGWTHSATTANGYNVCCKTT